MKFIQLFLIYFLCSFLGYSQPSQKEIMEKYNGSDISLLKSDEGDFYYKIQDRKTKKWGIYEASLDFENELRETFVDHRLTDPVFDEVIAIDYSSFFIVRAKKKYGIYHPVNYEWIGIEAPKQEYPYNKIHISSYDEIFVRKGKKWGVLGPYFGYLVSECLYPNPQAVPTDNVPILEQLGGVDIQTITFKNEIVYVIKDRETAKWGAFQLFEFEVYNPDGILENHFDYLRTVEPKYDSISTFESVDFFVVQENGKYGICYPAVEEEFHAANCIYDNISLKRLNGVTGVIGSINGKYGQINVLGENDLKLFTYSTVDEVPINDYSNSFDASLKILAMSGLNADRVEMDPINGDGIFRARNKTTKKWGMYQSLDAEIIQEMIPCVYDSIGFFAWNGDYVVVYNNRKMGLYLSPWAYQDFAKQTVPCLYDDYEWFQSDGRMRLACKRDGKWGWVNWFTGKKESDFNYNTSKDLPYPTYHQQTTIEE